MSKFCVQWILRFSGNKNLGSVTLNRQTQRFFEITYAEATLWVYIKQQQDCFLTHSFHHIKIPRPYRVEYQEEI